jgi:hypothetical protein
MEWPKSAYFPSSKELLFMKKNKLVRKETLNGYFEGITEGEIRKMLNLEGNVLIKDTKKCVIVNIN